MPNLQLFRYNGNEVAVVKSQNKVMINATQMAKPFSKQPRDFLKTDRIQQFIKALSIKQNCLIKDIVKTEGRGKEAVTWMHEKLALKFAEYLSIDFELWVNDVIEEVLKTGTYSLNNFILKNPESWNKTFPDEFMRQVMKLYGYNFDRTKGTPQFLGHFINKYIYNTLDKRMSNELKEARKVYGGDDEVAFLHQFLNTDGKDALIKHIEAITHIATGAPTIDQFEIYFNRIYVHRNQLEMYLR